MRINQSEITEDILEHIRQRGGALIEWCVGTALDAQAPFFRRHLAADLGDGLLSREAFTTYAIAEASERLAKGCGLHLDRDAVPQPGKIVFVNSTTLNENEKNHSANYREWCKLFGAKKCRDFCRRAAEKSCQTEAKRA